MIAALYVCIIAVGVFGLVMTSIVPQQRRIAAQEELIAAQKGLIAALNRKADAFERQAKAATNLADERGKTPPCTFGIPAEQLGGGKGI